MALYGILASVMIHSQAAKPASATTAPPPAAAQQEKHVSTGKVLATPAVRRVAIENKVDLKKVKGTGKDGRVLKEDVLKFLGQVKEDYYPGTTNIRSSPAFGSRPALKEYAPLTEDRVVPIRGYTRAMIKTMTDALKIPHFGYDDEYFAHILNKGKLTHNAPLEVCADALITIRKELKEMASDRGVKLSYMPFFIKAASLALLEFPSLNASVDEKLENIIYKASHNICLAMDTPGGLVVPNIKNCEQRSIFEIAAELQRLQEDGKREKISREDLAGGTFTISNIGNIGGTYVSPVIFPPQVAIGALGKIEKLPRYDKHDNLVPKNMFKVSWAADHRVVDGATMARFSNRWKFYLEHPSAMLAQLK
ncbi:2-oxo acid dehydrogenase acyltransferase [Ancylostoma caninum]|uniref:dihydrolipoyllysine-residue (2-methylpropanoyl)transferase n=1 Tax=Ancylostoma caninum TaxID=29170 RepID=A0A368G186_ANCCA|nr:2-oxo acid dehydrogenase acyltransferase [Ancylostoma caninum]